MGPRPARVHRLQSHTRRPAAESLFAFFCGRAALDDAADGTWGEIHGGPLEAEVEEGSGRSYKLWRFASLVPAGNVVFLAMEGITTSDRGEVCYGCSGSPISYWAYRPPAGRLQAAGQANSVTAPQRERGSAPVVIEVRTP